MHPPKCLLIYLWTRYMYFWSTHIFFLPTYKTVHPTSETTVTHEGKKGTQMQISEKDSFSSCWKKANFVPHLSAFSFVCYWQLLQIPNVAKLVTQQFLPPSFTLNCFSAYQNQVCWKPSQNNLPKYKNVGQREGAGRRNYFHSTSNSSCQEPHLAHTIILPTCTKCPSSLLQVIQVSTVDQKL